MGYILEYQKIDNYVRVAAVDECSGIEAISIFPTNISRAQMEEQAIKKLKYVMAKKQKNDNSGGGYV